MRLAERPDVRRNAAERDRDWTWTTNATESSECGTAASRARHAGARGLSRPAPLKRRRRTGQQQCDCEPNSHVGPVGSNGHAAARCVASLSLVTRALRRVPIVRLWLANGQVIELGLNLRDTRQLQLEFLQDVIHLRGKPGHVRTIRDVGPSPGSSLASWAGLPAWTSGSGTPAEVAPLHHASCLREAEGRMVPRPRANQLNEARRDASCSRGRRK